MFVDDLWIRMVVGLSLLGFSLMAIISPKLFPIRVNITGRTFPKRITSKIQSFTSWLGIPFGVLVLSGYRLENARHFGIVSLVLFVAMTVIYIYWVNSSDEEERSKTKRFWVFAFIGLAIFIAIGVFITIVGQDKIAFFSDYSPYPMMIFYLLMGVWHLIVVIKRERHSA